MSMDRRDLLRLGLTAGAAAVSACRGGAAAPRAGGAVAGGAVAVEEQTIAELQQHSCVSLLAAYRARIEALNTKGPELRAVLELDPDADANAAALDAERAAGKRRGPLHGIPVLLKDNIDTGDKMTTTAGSLALAGTHARKDAGVAAKLRAAGALLLGKTNLSEWANIRGTPSTSGWSARGGQCRNPYALDRSPSGSSSGSAVGVAASLCAVAIGTETVGSITSPASCTGVVGLKPTVGLVSRAGIVPVSSSQDTAGPLARTVTDAAILLTAIAGPDPDDPATAGAPQEDYTKHLDPDALRGARIGVPRKGWFGLLRSVDRIAEAALADLRRLGAEIVDIELPVPPALGPAELDVLLYELKAGLAAYLATRGPDTRVRTLADVIAFDTAHAADELVVFGQETFEKAQAKGPLTEQAYADARALCIKLARTEGLDRALDDNKLDAIVSATSCPAWLIDPVNGDSGIRPPSPMLPAVAGYPHITVPGGQFRGLPIGISLAGRAYSEGKLLGYAYAYEQGTHHRTPPAFLATAPAR